MAAGGAPLRQARHRHCLRDIPVVSISVRASPTAALPLLPLVGGITTGLDGAESSTTV